MVADLIKQFKASCFSWFRTKSYLAQKKRTLRTIPTYFLFSTSMGFKLTCISIRGIFSYTNHTIHTKRTTEVNDG
ncbi:MAG: hypothetical protein CVU39_17100 [Chloroflexi bacterium HGW-Chloroflexi-10]|nr:MAG: hypothetical protein CVU39_17100 [Chloroflexi bacterium HGW-Chloroflexi-10]